MNKKEQFAIPSAIWLGLANGALNAIKQLNEAPGKEFCWKDFSIALGKGAVVGAAGGYLIGAWADYQNDFEIPINTDAILFQVVHKVKLNPKSIAFMQLCQKTDWLVSALKKEFAEQLKSEPFRFGSTEKGTALRNSSDIDVCLAFKPDSFCSTEDMYLSVLGYLKKFVGVQSITNVRSQNKSIGVSCNIYGRECKIDFLPKKITNSRRNKSSGYLYVNATGLFSEKSYTKTDVPLLNSLCLTEAQKRIIILLKHWKTSEDLPLKSHLLENLVLDAYLCNRGNIPRQFTQKVIMVLRHIANYLDTAIIRGIENTNNVLTDIPQSDKATIIKACKKIVQEFDYQPNSITRMFK